MARNVNLDALIPREDFEVAAEPSTPSARTSTIAVSDLEAGKFFYAAIRKPDFQRETSDWTPQKIADFVKSYLAGDLIPAIILWGSGQYVFVIDGAHRLSALVAWVQDDYGDGKTSREFFEGVIPEEQIAIAKRTREAISKTVGSYEEHLLALRSPEKVRANIVESAKRLAQLGLQLQWVNGNATKAEASFFKINQQAAPIDASELKLLQSRRKPNAIAARAIVRAGTGHKYWNTFDDAKQRRVEELAKEIYQSLFVPELENPIKTLDLPIAGKGYSPSSLPNTFDFVNIANGIGEKATTENDADGATTISYLERGLRVARRISGTDPSSLGLHPIVYFYSATGRYQPTAFLAIVKLIQDIESATNGLKTFTTHRATFEAFLIKYRALINQTVRKFGSGLKGYPRLYELLKQIFDLVQAGKSIDEVAKTLTEIPAFSFLQPAEIEEQTKSGKAFSPETKSAAFIREALRNPLKCSICSGLIHMASISIDHKIRKADGGSAGLENAQLTHPYCNSTFKN